MSILSNYKLKELMKKETEMTKEEYEIFLNEFRKSELFIPIQVELDSLDLNELEVNKINKVNQEINFRLKSYLSKDNKRTIPLFTDEKEIEKLELNTTVGSLFMRDLYESIIPIKDSFDQIVIDPKSENRFKISVDEFLNLFDEKKEFEDLMKEIENDEEFKEMLKREQE